MPTPRPRRTARAPGVLVRDPISKPGDSLAIHGLLRERVHDIRVLPYTNSFLVCRLGCSSFFMANENLAIPPTLHRLLVHDLQPSVIATAKTIREAHFTISANLHDMMILHVEAFLRDEQWVPELVASSECECPEIMLSFLPLALRGGLPGHVMAERLKRGLLRSGRVQSISIGMGVNRIVTHAGGRPRDSRPNGFKLLTLGCDTKPLVTEWDIEVDEDRVVRGSVRSIRAREAIGQHWAALFPGSPAAFAAMHVGQTFCNLGSFSA